MSCLLLKMFLLCLWLKSSVCRCRFICIVAKFNNTKTKLNTWETYNWRQQAQSIMFETPTCYWIRFEEMNKQNELSDKQYHVHLFPQTYSKMKEQFKCTFCTIRILFFLETKLPSLEWPILGFHKKHTSMINVFRICKHKKWLKNCRWTDVKFIHGYPVKFWRTGIYLLISLHVLIWIIIESDLREGFHQGSSTISQIFNYSTVMKLILVP